MTPQGVRAGVDVYAFVERGIRLLGSNYGSAVPAEVFPELARRRWPAASRRPAHRGADRPRRPGPRLRGAAPGRRRPPRRRLRCFGLSPASAARAGLVDRAGVLAGRRRVKALSGIVASGASSVASTRRVTVSPNDSTRSARRPVSRSKATSSRWSGRSPAISIVRGWSHGHEDRLAARHGPGAGHRGSARRQDVLAEAAGMDEGVGQRVGRQGRERRYGRDVPGRSRPASPTGPARTGRLGPEAVPAAVAADRLAVARARCRGSWSRAGRAGSPSPARGPGWRSEDLVDAERLAPGDPGPLLEAEAEGREAELGVAGEGEQRRQVRDGPARAARSRGRDVRRAPRARARRGPSGRGSKPWRAF